ncbi:MAG: menaquinone biosynthesis protein [Gammaproteobacteria bacterium]|nr:menaquinone biosynthesis protein [Gammaproteobacteria bacterium]
MHETARVPAPALKIAGISYLNAEPFCRGLDRTGIDLQRLAPVALGRMAGAGHADAALLSLVDYFRLSGCFEPLGDFGIATRDRTRSVLLFSHRPFAALGGAVIGVSDETATSVQLLKVLLAGRYRVQPRHYVDAAARCDACLLIGDPALRYNRANKAYAFVYDLGAEWHAWTGLPFVFALWTVRRSLPESSKRTLESLVGGALERGLAELDQISRARNDTGLGAQEIIDYLRGFRYVIGAQEKRAVTTFRSLLESP